MTLLQDQIHHSFSVLFDHMDQSHQRCIISHSERILLCEYKIKLYIDNLIAIFKYWWSQKKSNFTCITTVSSQFWNRSPIIYGWIIHLSTTQVIWMAIWSTHHIELALCQNYEIRISATLKLWETAKHGLLLPAINHLPWVQPFEIELLVFSWEQERTSDLYVDHSIQLFEDIPLCYSHLVKKKSIKIHV